MRLIFLIIPLITLLFPKEVVAVLDLEPEGLSGSEARVLTQRLTSELIEIGKYTVVERNSINKILEEQKFQNSGCTDSECAVEIGQLINSDFIVIGNVSKFGSAYSIDARLINVGTGQALESAKFTHKGERDVLLDKGVLSVANQLCGYKKNRKFISSKPKTRKYIMLPSISRMIVFINQSFSEFRPQYPNSLDITNIGSTSELDLYSYKLFFVRPGKIGFYFSYSQDSADFRKNKNKVYLEDLTGEMSEGTGTFLRRVSSSEIGLTIQVIKNTVLYVGGNSIKVRYVTLFDNFSSYYMQNRQPLYPGLSAGAIFIPNLEQQDSGLSFSIGVHSNFELGDGMQFGIGYRF